MRALVLVALVLGVSGAHAAGIAELQAFVGDTKAATATFAQETRDSRLVVLQLLAKHLEGDGAVLWMIRTKDRRRATFADLSAYRIAGHCRSH